jgi:hypothetical protein
MEHFYQNNEEKISSQTLKLTINNVNYEWNQQYITGAEIRKLGHIAQEDEIFLAIKKPWEDEPITNDKQVNLARPEIEHFYSKNKYHEITLIINGRQKPWAEKYITFEQVVTLAYGNYDSNPNRVYTVTYDRGPHENSEGTMVKGDKVLTKDKMIFNVTCTDKS